MLVGGVGTVFLFARHNVSEGQKTGTVVEMSRTPSPFKTWDGRLTIKSGDKEYDWDFSVAGQAMSDRVAEAQKAGKAVTLKYKQKAMVVPWKGGTPFNVTEIVVHD